ncbi:MAG: tRNA (N(6)-L-threonylcarbamoyladenosine(37)-C(2))-methylthiotransferase MtaB [Rhodospirillales bacterium]|nr:tRNA (N(6)-L-threonylcarbamoyladenosine(37)-C(2))-methylthiotransferase MtaB [Rhodospirillales bacterium]MBO6788153.1 tRNA (N(6)-L-threonylcarbamoyladenosine(37)-C(2))-methylthiotransferase MtaB [Rhodospirillales bacterium]
MSAPEVITMGCRLNAFESEVIRDHAGRARMDDAIIVNTCAVTAEAERQARQTIRRMRRKNPGKRIIVTGCAAQLNPRGFADMPEVDHVIGNEEKMKAETFAGLNGHPEVRVADIMTVRETASHLVKGFDGRARAFVQIQQGCDHRCTFCIIPFARGNNRSVPLGAIVEQTRTLVSEGYREIVLTGVDICSYGTDLPGQPQLGEIVKRLLVQVPELERLRLSSLDPAAMDDTLFDVLANETRLMPHLHLSLQAMDDMVLKRMKRRHLRDEAMRVAERARAARADVVLGADLIAGFPTEDDDMFENTLAAVAEMGLTHLHVFPYSERDGTPAAKMPAVDVHERKKRAERLRATGDAALDTFMKAQVGKDVQVLVEKDNRGLSEHYVPAEILGGANAGEIVAGRVTGITDGTLQVQRIS